MPSFSAAIFVTSKRPLSDEQDLEAYAFLFEGSRPYWEIHIDQELFRFIPDPSFMFEEGVWQLLAYCKRSDERVLLKPNSSGAALLSDHFSEEELSKARQGISSRVGISGYSFALLNMPGSGITGKEKELVNWQDAKKTLKEIKSFLDGMNS